jgi:hypothetical protein
MKLNSQNGITEVGSAGVSPAFLNFVATPNARIQIIVMRTNKNIPAQPLFARSTRG